jgi:hypothetical protein
MLEPVWSTLISNITVCTWFYAVALVNLLFGTAGILSGLYLMSKGKENVLHLLAVCAAVSISFMNAWFLFLVCNRSLVK